MDWVIVILVVVPIMASIGGLAWVRFQARRECRGDCPDCECGVDR